MTSLIQHEMGHNLGFMPLKLNQKFIVTLLSPEILTGKVDIFMKE